ncbi:DUF4832 domain-containing protein [Microbacterium indicum]|uniref:DUF4832 domain-containing protein n=1 Tax=Microbacterium indicum TaxID=358100 RepID=UPI0004198044|nr:DUF4832 domain-containing protein [Microbacterium indicum]
MGQKQVFGRRSVLGMGAAGALAVTASVVLPRAAHAATGSAAPAHSSTSTSGGTLTTTFDHDPDRFLRNPLNGFVLYSTATVADDYWEHYDSMQVPGIDGAVKVSDYAPTLYMRIAWSALEPEEGAYAWDADTKVASMIAEARRRDMRLAFRIVVDSRDKPVGFTPDYVRDAGAEGYESQTGDVTLWSPYPDDPVFQEKYAAFLTAFAARFGDPEEMDFVDGYGLGLWGEGHTMKYRDPANREAVFRWNVDLFTRLFPDVPIALNYHRTIGSEVGWGSADPQSRALLDYAYGLGWILRHDAFGMTTYYGQWEREVAGAYLFKRPILMEGGWVTASHSISDDPRGYETAADVRQGEFDDSQQAHVNAMDFRVGETDSWFEECFDLVKEFNAEGGYRLLPQSVQAPSKVARGGSATIAHTWVNRGWAYFPSDLAPWHGKYQVAFALLDGAGEPVEVYADDGIPTHTWRERRTYDYTTTPTIGQVARGRYRWGVAIVDTTRDSAPAIELATSAETTESGWLVVGGVTVS